MPRPNKIRLSLSKLARARRVIVVLVNRPNVCGTTARANSRFLANSVDITLQYARRNHGRFSEARVPLMLRVSQTAAPIGCAIRLFSMDLLKFRRASKRLHFFNHKTVAYVESAIDTCPRRDPAVSTHKGTLLRSGDAPTASPPWEMHLNIRAYSAA